MSTITGIFRVNADGNVVVPVGPERAGSDVEVTITPKVMTKSTSEMTPAEYAAFIESIEGKWVGEFPDLEDRPPEERDPL